MPVNNSREVQHLEINKIWIDCSVRESHGMTAQCTQFPVEEGANVTDHVRTQPETIHVEGIVTNTPTETPKSHLGTSFFAHTSAPLLDGEGNAITTTWDNYKSTPIEGEPMYGWLSVLPFVGQAYDLSRASSNPRTPKKKLSMERSYPANIRNNISMSGLQMIGGMSNVDPLESEALGLHVFGTSVDRVADVAAALRDSFARRKPVEIVTAYRTYLNAILTELTVTRDGTTGGNALMFSAQCQLITVVGVTYGSPVPTQERATPAKAKGTQNTVPTKPGEVSPDQKRKTGFLKQLGRDAAKKFKELQDSIPEP
jgi:hypothetical protein